MAAEMQKAGGFPPGLKCAAKTEKPGVGLLSTLGFRSCNLVRLPPKSHLYPGQTAKIKAAPKGKGKIGEEACRNHGAHICPIHQPMSSIKYGVFLTTVYNPISAAMKERANKLEATLFAEKSGVFQQSSDGIWVRQQSVDGQSIVQAQAF